MIRSAVLAVVAAAALLASCAEEQLSDEAFRSLLIGKWGETREIGNEVHKQVIRLNQDGSFDVSGNITTPAGKNSFSFGGSWDVRQGHFWYKTLTSHPKEFYPAGEEHRDRILSVTRHEWVMVEQSTGQKSRARRYQDP